MSCLPGVTAEKEVSSVFSETMSQLRARRHGRFASMEVPVGSPRLPPTRHFLQRRASEITVEPEDASAIRSHLKEHTIERAVSAVEYEQLLSSVPPAAALSSVPSSDVQKVMSKPSASCSSLAVPNGNSPRIIGNREITPKVGVTQSGSVFSQFRQQLAERSMQLIDAFPSASKSSTPREAPQLIERATSDGRITAMYSMPAGIASKHCAAVWSPRSHYRQTSCNPTSPSGSRKPRRFSQEVFQAGPQGPAPESLNLRAPPYFGSSQGMRRLPVGKKAPSALDLLPKAIEGTVHDRTLSDGNLSNATTASTINGDRGFRPSIVRRGGHLALPDRK
jgi:hypothetical protein